LQKQNITNSYTVFERNFEEHILQLTSEIFTAAPASIHNGGAHLFWAVKPSESLVQSISEFGQTTPVIVCETENGLELIAGHARHTVLSTTGQPVLARMATDISDTDKGLLYLADNSQRVISDGMRLTALKYFVQLMNERQLKADILPRFNIKPKSKDAKLLLAWLTLDARWQALLESGNVPLAAATPLARMNSEEQNAVVPLFTTFSWSRSNAVNVLTWLFETAKMRASSVQEVMQQAGMTDILSQGLSPKDAIQKLATAARLARYPELTRLQDAFATAAREITAGTRWRMNQPNNFETGGSELTIQVKDADQLAQAAKDLHALSGSATWDTIWKLGGGND